MQSISLFSAGRGSDAYTGVPSHKKKSGQGVSAATPGHLPPPSSSPVSTVDAIAIRRFFEFAAVNMKEGQMETVDSALFLLHEMGKSLVTYWEGPKSEMGNFERQKLAFEQQALPDIINKIPKLEKLTAVTSPTVHTVDAIALRRFFESTAINMKETQRDALDLALYFLHEMGKSLVTYWNDPRKGRGEFVMQKLALEQQALPRLINKVYQREKVSEIKSPKEQAKTAFEEEVTRLLNERLFLNLKEPVNSDFNRKMLISWNGKNEQIFKQMELLERANRQLENPGESSGSRIGMDRLCTPSVDFEISDEVSRLSESDPAVEKMDNDYHYLRGAFLLLDSHRVAVLDICKELNNPNLLTSGTSKRVVSDILSLVNKHTESPWAIVNANRTMVKREWINAVHHMIKFRYLAVFEQGTVEQYRSLLIENLKCQPSQIQSFEKLSLDLLRKLFDQELPHPDVLNAFTLEDSIRCYINGKEVKPAINNLRERYDLFLTTFGQLFGQPDMFIYLDQQIATFTFRQKELRMDKDYAVAYRKLWQLETIEKEILRAMFSKRYGPGLFDKVFKYFKVCQNILGEEVTSHFTSALLLARCEKLKRNTFEITPVKSTAGSKKSEVKIQVNGSKCEMSIMRFDGLLNTEAMIRQAYTIIFDVNEDVVIPPSQEMLSISIECPSYLQEENPEIKALLFDLPLIMDSLNFHPLKINFLNIPKSSGREDQAKA